MTCFSAELCQSFPSTNSNANHQSSEGQHYNLSDGKSSNDLTYLSKENLKVSDTNFGLDKMKTSQLICFKEVYLLVAVM